MKASTHPNLYTLPRRERDPMGVIFPSIGIVVWLGAASCWAATEMLRARSAINARSVSRSSSTSIRPFNSSPGRSGSIIRHALGLQIHHVFLHAYEIVLFGNGLGMFVAASMAARRIRRLQRHTDLHGSAHWASREEIRATGLLGRDRGVYVGAWRDPQSKRTKYLRDPSSTHCLAFMPTGSGKTVGLVIPTLLSWERSAVVHDVKGEIWHKTAGLARGEHRARRPRAARLQVRADGDGRFERPA